MSENPTLVTREHFRYVAERTDGDDDFLRALKAAAVEAGLPRIQIAPAQGAFLQVVLRIAGAREVVEVGTLGGYSAIWMARALPEGGRVRTIEVDERYADFAESWVSRSDVSERVEVLRGRGQTVLPALPDRSVDAMFLDADKAGYVTYMEEAMRLLRPGGVLLADNAFAFGQLYDEAPGDPEAPAIRAFNDRLAREARFQGVIVPLGDGCWMAVLR